MKAVHPPCAEAFEAAQPLRRANQGGGQSRQGSRAVAKVLRSRYGEGRGARSFPASFLFRPRLKQLIGSIARAERLDSAWLEAREPW